MSPETLKKLELFADLLDKSPGVEAVYAAGFATLDEFSTAIKAMPKNSALRARISASNRRHLKGAR